MQQAKKILLSSNYLAPIRYYAKLAKEQPIIIEQYDHYIKQTYRNRCKILGANGIQTLSIPIVKPAASNSFMKDIRISDHNNWQRLHWNAIISAYSSTPFFEYYQDDFIPFYTQKFNYLFDFNESLQQMICGLLALSPQIEYSTEYMKEPIDSFIEDWRTAIHPKMDPLYTGTEYYQLFRDRHGFIPHLSIIDLLFNEGPQSELVLLEKE